MRLVLIWLLFFAYVALMVYLYIKVDISEEPQNGTVEKPAIADTSQLQQEVADSLLALVYQAYENEEYDVARKIALELETNYPNSTHAEMASRLIDAINKDGLLSERTVTEPPAATPTLSPPLRDKQPARVTTTPAKRTIGSPKTPTHKTEEVSPKPSAPKMDPAAVNRIMAKVREVSDPESGVTWYYNKFLSHYVYKNSLEAYIGRDESGEIWLQVRIYYTGEKLLNIESYEIYADDQVYTISTLNGTIERGKGPKGAWEWFDMQASEKEIAMLTRVMNADRAAIRYIGDNGTFERPIGELEKLRLSYIIQAYEVLASQNDLLSSNVGRR